jgi:outer membrane protein assembly factor BamD (BamD/ComL family)
MKQWVLRLVLVLFFVLAFPFRSPAPLVYRVGEGWTYETPGEELGAWRRPKAKDQLDVAQAAFDKKDYSLARKAANRVVTTWPFSDYSPQAEYLLARCDEANRKDERAFKEYQKLLEKYPKAANYDEVVQRQFEICNRFLNGERFKLWNFIPTFPSMEKTVKLYEGVIKNGPYSEVAPQAQMNIGAARERQWRLFNDSEPYMLAAKAYELAADRYRNRPKLASDAMFKAGLAYDRQARTAEYDQSTAGKAIDTFKDFKTLYPDDPRATEGEKMIASLKTEQARGNYEIARFYEHGHHWKSALVYYNEVVIKDPKSPYAATSLQRIAELKKLTAPPAK